MTNEEAIDILEHARLMSGFPAQIKFTFDTEGIEALEMAIKALEQARHKGKWIILDECANEGVYCSECHKKIFKLEFSLTMKWRNFKYCPNCGADMRGDSE